MPGDPLAGALNSPVGGLAIEPSTRRRMRLNGEAFTSGDGVTIALEQVFSNCPKYIATRAVPTPWRRRRAGARAGRRADARARELLAAADTAFVATRGLDGLDASHRGGRPGFLQTPDAHSIVWPDYSGNNMFKTLGNIAADGAAGLTVVDPADGTTLHVSGHAEFDESRTIRLTVDAVVRRDRVAPLRGASSAPPATRRWRWFSSSWRSRRSPRRRPSSRPGSSCRAVAAQPIPSLAGALSRRRS